MITLTSAKQPLHGELTVPGDKSISHRAVMFGSIARGDTHISGFLNGADCLSTIDCFRRLGISIDLDEGRQNSIPQGSRGLSVTVHGKGMHGLSAGNGEAGEAGEVELYTGNSGTTTRIISGILAPQHFTTVLSGDASINQRPMKRIIEPLTRMGARIESLNGNDCAPLRITGTAMHGCGYKSPVSSAQVKSSVLCAGLYADSPTTVIEPSLSRDHSERMLASFGAKLMTLHMPNGFHVGIFPADELFAQEIDVPGDISSAAFFIVAALLVPGSEILLRNVNINPTRAGIIQVLKEMGADITLQNSRGGRVNGLEQQGMMPSSQYAGGSTDSNGPEPVADLLVKYSVLHGTTVSGEIIPTLIDELPVIAVAASLASGVTFIKDAAELKVKESDRITVMTEGLKAMGSDIAATPDGWVINGVEKLHGAEIACHADHRIAMSFAVASLAADGETVLDDEKCVRISYPEFFEDLKKLC